MTCHAKSSAAAVITSVGKDTFSITRQASNGFSRDTDALKAEVSDDAAKYCAEHGKQLKVVSLTADKPRFAMGYVSAKIVFKALDATDPELTATPAVSTGGGVIERPSTTADLYNDILKLDDLRKRGLLTEEEFQIEKKKVLNRTR